MLEPILQAQPSAELRIAYLEVRKGTIDAEKQMAELTDLLNQLLGLPAGTCLELTEPVLPLPPVACCDDAALHALANNPQIREAEQNINKANAGFKAVRMEWLPDVNVVGAYVGQDAADYIQPNFTAVGVTGSYLFVDWGKRRMIKHQRETQRAMAQHNVDVVAESVQLEARKAYAAFKQTHDQLHIANESVAAYQEAEKGAHDPRAMMTAKGATAKAQLDQMMAELNYRVAHAKLCAAIGQQ
ncbi:MAG: TolC family protein [Gemmataceae bacterium]